MANVSTQRVRAHRQRMRAAKPPRAPRKPPKSAMQRAREFRARQRALRSAALLSSLPTIEFPTTDNNENQSEPSTSKKRPKKTRYIRKRLPYSSFDANHAARRYFKAKFYDNPFGSVCEICDRLWFQNELRGLSPPHQRLLARKLPDQDLSILAACKCCVQSLSRNHIPTFAKFNGFKYPKKPAHLPQLDSVSERLISPRIPFLQIRRLQNVDNDDKILGQIINVPLSENNMVYQLPRNLFDDYCINVNIDEQKIYQSTDLMDLVNKEDIEAWLQYLVTTPLYISHNVKINEPFFYDKNFDKNPRVVVTESSPSDSSLTAQQQTLLWNVDKYLQVAPSEGNVVPHGSLFDDHAEELSFPSIYLGQFRIYKDGFRITPFTIVSSELKRADRRGVTPQHLLYMAMKIMRIRVNDALNATKLIGKDLNTTKQQMLSEEYISQSLETNLGFLKCIPNSSWYWTERKRDLFTMLRQLGKPTMSLRLSANEIGWPSLLKILYKLQHGRDISEKEVSKLDALEKSTLVNEDAVACTLHFNKLLNVLMTILQSKKGNPFEQYHVTHYFQHLEFQLNGSPQAHILLWLKKAPKDALDTDKADALTLIDKVTSVSKKEASKIIDHQIHHHSAKCYSKEDGNGTQVCRFGAPFMPSRFTMILTPMPKADPRFIMNAEAYKVIRQNLEDNDYVDINDFYDYNEITSDEHYTDIIRAGITRPQVFLKREPSEKWHEAFNPFILNVLQANMNIQFIPDEYSCADYVVDYINKADSGISDLRRRIIAIINENPEFNINDLTKELSVDLLNTVEITSQEAAWYLLREPMSKSSSVVIHIPTVRPEERPKVRKNHHQLVGLDLDEDSIDVWKESWYDKYETRPTELEDVTLAKFVANYTRKPNGTSYVKRRYPCLIRYRTYNMITHPDEYKREMVTLHVAFRNEELEILTDNKFLQLYEQQEEAIFIRRQEFESDFNVQKTLDKFNRLFCGENIVVDKPEVARLLPIEPESDPLGGLGEEEISDMNWEFRGETSTITEPIVNFIPAIFDPTILVKTEEPEEPSMHTIFSLLTKKSTPFQIFLSGPVACGKTFIIRIMTEIYNRYKYKGGQCNVFTNYTSTNKTGITIDNSTIYTTLRISISKLLPLTLEQAEQYRELFDYIHILIIDEINTISADVVSHINKRLRQITGNFDINFGGISIILVGQLRQSTLGPTLPIANLLNTLKFLELEKVMHQSNELFTLILTKIEHSTKLQDPELRLLESRFFSEDEADRFCHQGIRIFASNDAANEYNQAILDSADNKIVSVANDVYIGCHCTEQAVLTRKFHKMSITETRGLPYEIIFVPHKLYIVTTTIDVSLGLITGALGTLIFLERDISGEVIKVWLELLNSPMTAGRKRKRSYPSAQVKSISETAVPVERRRWSIPLNDEKTIIVTRDHFPLVPACALSMDNAEGKTFNQIVYEYNESHSQQLVYTALSRVTKITGLYIVTTNNDPTFHHGRKTLPSIISLHVESDEVTDDKTLTMDKVLIDFIISRTTLSVLSFDSQSCRIQSADLNDVVRKKPGILLLLETSPDDNDKLKAPVFNCEMRFKDSPANNGQIAVRQVTNDRTNIITDHMNVNFRHSTSIIVNSTDVGEICGARCNLDNDKTIITIMIYVSPDKNVPQIIEFIHEVLLVYTVQGSALLKRNLHKIPMILGGNFDINFDSTAAKPLIKFLNDKLNLKINNDPAILPSTTGMVIDGVFSRHLEQLESTSYVLYSSYDRPVVTFLDCQPMDTS